MNDLQVFKNSEFGELGVMVIEGREYFPATACAKKLGYKDPYKAIKSHCKSEGWVNRPVVTHTKNQHGTESNQTVDMKFIPEGDLYRLIVSSKLPTAERFERWVFDEVLPALRKQGAYMPDVQGIVIHTAKAVATELISNLLPIIAQCLGARSKEVKNETPAPHNFETVNIGNQCKLETFPAEIRERVDALMLSMIEQQALNFSQIARFCTVNGYTISSPSVKIYFQRRYNTI